MLNNPTNNNKTNNHLSPQTTEHKKTTAYGVRNAGPCLEQAQHGSYQSINVIPTLDNWIYNDYTDMVHIGLNGFRKY